MPRFLVTSALPYANGPIHFGHIAGAYLPADVFVRFTRARYGPDSTLYICGTDEHGAPITANAKKAGKSYEEFTKHWHDVILDVFTRVGIEFDNFSRTSLPHHHELSQRFFRAIQDAGFILEKSESQPYCETDSMFLPDRYLEGTCPKCGHEKARGDECPKCAHWVESGTLEDPRCKLCGNPAVIRETTHWYLDLAKLQPSLERWLKEEDHGPDGPRWATWKPNVKAAIDKWFKERLRPRAITRDLDWGVPVPVEGAEGKVLYVWFDAPIGYISSTIEWAERQGTPEAWRDWWVPKEGETYEDRVRLVHFIGKDNIVFHCLTWPAMLSAQARSEEHGQPLRLPDDVPANEFFNLEGDKFNTSEGWFIDLEDFFAKYCSGASGPDALRYHLARVMPETADSEWQWSDFQAKVNNELNDTYGNLAQRTLKFLGSRFDGRWPPDHPEKHGEGEAALLEALEAAPGKVGACLERHKIRAGAQEFMELARAANRYLNDAAPWKSFKADKEACETTLHLVGRVLAALAVLGQPLLPRASQGLWEQVGFDTPLGAARWDDAARLTLPESTGEVAPLFEKIPDEAVERELAALRERKERMTAPDAESTEEGATVELEPFRETCTFDDFMKVDLRVGVVKEAEAVEKSKKLLKLQVDLGHETRQILAGLKQFFSPEDIQGRRVVVVANLAPRKMMGMESQGMILAADDPKTGEPVLLKPDEDLLPGASVH